MTKWVFRCFVILTMSLLGLAACGDDSSGGGSQSLDAGADSAADAQADGGADADSDASQAACTFPDPEIAGTAKTDALAQSAGQCGQADSGWLDDPALGEVTELGTSKEFPAAFIDGILQNQGVTPPRPIEHDAQVVQFAYKTQDRGQLIEASAMLAYPKDIDPSQPLDVVLLLHGTTGFNDACAPSNDLASRGLAALFASLGYLVVAPDYIGLKGLGDPTGFLHPYLVGQVTAMASLDALRAANNLPTEDRGGHCFSSEFLAFGGSQGGHATLWVDRLQPYYAREMTLLGAVATVPPADLVAEMERALQSLVDATGNTVAFLGSVAGWYGQKQALDEVFVSPLDTKVPQLLGESCSPDPGEAGDPTETSDIFQQTLIDAAVAGNLDQVDPWGCITAENGLTTTSIERIEPELDSYGMLYVLGEKDQLVHTPIERDSFETLCNQGMELQFLECAEASHTEATFFALPEILDFMDARFARESFDADAHCTVNSPVTCRGTQ